MRQGLGTGEADGGLCAAVDWEALYRLSRSQSVVAWVWDGINRLPEACRPPRDVAMRFFADAVRVEKASCRLEEGLARLLADVSRLGAPCAVLKGPAYAALYPRPHSRQPGDIDLFTGRWCADVQRGLPPDYGRDGGPAYFHEKLWLDGLLVENHRLPAEFAWPPYNRRMRRMVDEWFPHAVPSRPVGGRAVPVPPPWFELVHAVVHFSQHLVGSGVGLRQLCDWVVLLRAHSGSVPPAELSARLRRLGLLPAAGVMARLAVDLLGLDADLPLVRPLLPRARARTARRAAADILRAGNFGQSEAIRRQSGWRAEMADLLVLRGRRSLRYVRLWPAEVASQPLVRLWRFFARKAGI